MSRFNVTQDQYSNKLALMQEGVYLALLTSEEAKELAMKLLKAAGVPNV